MSQRLETLYRNQQPKRARILIWLSLIIVIFLLVWAKYAWIDEVVRGEAKVVPSRQIQVIQSLDGGVIEQILVRNGQVVEEGEVLLRIDPTRYSSSLGESQAEMLGLQAKAARLEALATGEDVQISDEISRLEPALAAMEMSVWQASNQGLLSNLSVFREQLNQRQQELRETQANRDQAASSCSLTSKELQMTRPLLQSGAVSEVDLLRLQRDVAKYCGESKAAVAQIDRIKASIQEAEQRLIETEVKFRSESRTELAEVRAKLATLEQGQLALVDRVRLAEVRSPVRGTIKSLHNNTVGGVVQPGKDIVEIVPADDTLLLEVRINPRDIGFLYPGQTAEVKFTAYDFAVYGGMQGELEQTSADTITDEKGNSFYIAQVRTEQSYVGEDNRPILPGMIADVHILTGKRTVLQYLLKPILRARENAFTER